ncbi:anhydro-N-acetylmuramic acid kinase [Methylophilus rhizosphaerae]|uniref:Anhydro-N-acetylmuramic acid kinase n=2 Tax=Methylophilus rhizosphaerae TaxID=492660 RepID=A0A1G9CGA1_9PROT|nr:anhydro-N-acetylmuramic acid kinase [Methylophilus rhizosphaerae]
MIHLRLMSASTTSSSTRLFIGLMSGTSLDGVDAVVVSQSGETCTQTGQHFLPYPDSVRQTLLALHTPAHNELHDAAIMANTLADLYASAVHQLLDKYALAAGSITAIGCHGQTIRHCPELANGQAYTLQLGNHARLAELTGITVIGDFRSRDIAAGGQGAPLVPAFHQAVFASPDQHRVIINIGGIANLSDLPRHGTIAGFDSGPGNLLMDAWTQQHTGQTYDAGGAWAASGEVNTALLQSLLSDPYFSLPPPKSTGRDLFNSAWLARYLHPFNDTPVNIARTLVALTAQSIADAVTRYCADVEEVYVCGGGAHNQLLLSDLRQRCACPVQLTDALGVGVDWVEAVAFAWLAQRTIDGLPGNIPAVTGAQDHRILGAIYPK